MAESEDFRRLSSHRFSSFDSYSAMAMMVHILASKIIFHYLVTLMLLRRLCVN